LGWGQKSNKQTTGRHYLDQTNELNVEWDGDASAGAKAIADHFKRDGWEAAWFQGGDTRRFRALHVPTGRDVQGRIVPPTSKGVLKRLLPASGKCRVKVTIVASEADREELEATIMRLLKTVGARK
jgi:hypothetical protein